MQEDRLKYQFYNSRIANPNQPIKELAEELDISYSKCVRWRKELDDAKLAGDIKLFMNMDSAVIGELISSDDPQVAAAITRVTELKSSLEVLATDLQDAASLIIRHVRANVMSSPDRNNLAVATEILAKLQDSFFNSKAVQVNIQNNVGESKYGAFLNDKPLNN